MEQNRNTAKKRRMQPRCLACGVPFAAESPFLRVCPTCKTGEEWQSGADFSLQEPANDNRRGDNLKS